MGMLMAASSCGEASGIYSFVADKKHTFIDFIKPSMVSFKGMNISFLIQLVRRSS